MHQDGIQEEQIQRWLAWLRDGTDTEKVAARNGLARVCEHRGLLDDAIELLENNVRAGVRDGTTFRWLAHLYRAQGEEDRSLAAAAEASKYHAATIVRDTLPDLSPDPSGAWTRRSLIFYVVAILGCSIVITVVLWLMLPTLQRG